MKVIINFFFFFLHVLFYNLHFFFFLVDKVQPREVQKYSEVKLHWKVRHKLKGSGFDLMFDMAHKVSIIKPLLVALVRRYDPKSGLFELGQQKNIKLLFGLQDVFRITGLPIDGKPVCLDTKYVKKLGAGEFTKLTGLECDKTTISLQTLADEINNSYDEINSNANMDRIDQICRIVTLLGIGCMVMQGGHSQIRLDYIRLLRDVDEIKNYAWGAASWANLHSSLINVAIRDGTNLFGSVFALMVISSLV